jgi:hypothetical protein
LARHREYVLKLVEAGDETTREFDEEVAGERRAQGSTVAALNAFSAPGAASELRAKLKYADRDDAIQRLAAEVEKGTLRVPRLLVLDSLVKLASRRPDELRKPNAALDTLLEALVRQARGPEAEAETEAEVRDAVLTVRAALNSVASLGVESTTHPWEAFVQEAGPALRLTQAEIEKPLCNDAERVKKGGFKPATGVTVEFLTDASPDALRHFCDPMRWHECSAYQKPMEKLPGGLDQPGPGPHGWRRDLLEKVQLSPTMLLTTPLRFTYGIEDENDPDWVHLDYLLLEDGTQTDILVDEGSLDVRRVTSGKHQGRTRVRAIKAILFADPLLAEWTTVACDTFWMDLVINAAVGCLGPTATLDSTGGKAKMAESKEPGLDETIDEAAAAAERSIETYRVLAKQAAAQLAGDSPAGTDRWVDLTAKTWAQVARDTAQAWMTYNAVLQGFAESGEGKAKQPDPGEGDNDS